MYSTRLKSQGVAGLASERVERRLTAILAADVAGYSRLMGTDEEETLARLKAHRRELVDPRIDEHHGRIVKTTGDGLLVEFASVVDAVRCAVEIQGEMSKRIGRPRRSRANLRPPSRSASAIDRLLKYQNPLGNCNNLRPSSPRLVVG